MFSYELLLLILETCYTLNCLSEIMTIFLNYLLIIGQGQGHRNKRLPQNVYFFISKVICLQFVVILSLHIIKCSLNTNTFLLQKCLQCQG